MSECWGEMSKCGSVLMNSNDKMKKLVNMMKQMKMIKRFSVSGSRESGVSLRLPRNSGQSKEELDDDHHYENESEKKLDEAISKYN